MPEDKITLLIRMIREKAETSDISSIKREICSRISDNGRRSILCRSKGRKNFY